MRLEIHIKVNLSYIFVLQEVGVKMESTKARHPQLLYESKVYKLLLAGPGAAVPKIR